VITATDGTRPLGMSANSFTSVSLDPPLILFCPARSSTTWPDIKATGRCCVNVLAGHHEELSRRFSLKGIDRFDTVPYAESDCGPRLTEAVAWIDCVLRDEHEAGDHTIVVATVIGLEASADSSPLVFHRGAYGTFAPGAR
jgi:flavin reductase (DIM6/NTAB) family NADH-FMN oxidoreductase RutF